MKNAVLVAMSLAAIAVAGPAQASEELAKKHGCLTCHAVDTKKMGPSFKDIAKKNKANAAAENELVTKLKSGKGHPPVKAPDDELKALVKWTLSQ